MQIFQIIILFKNVKKMLKPFVDYCVNYLIKHTDKYSSECILF